MFHLVYTIEHSPQHFTSFHLNCRANFTTFHLHGAFRKSFSVLTTTFKRERRREEKKRERRERGSNWIWRCSQVEFIFSSSTARYWLVQALISSHLPSGLPFSLSRSNRFPFSLSLYLINNSSLIPLLNSQWIAITFSLSLFLSFSPWIDPSPLPFLPSLNCPRSISILYGITVSIPPFSLFSLLSTSIILNPVPFSHFATVQYSVANNSTGSYILPLPIYDEWRRLLQFPRFSLILQHASSLSLFLFC